MAFLVLVLVRATPVSAHSVLIESDPANGAVLATAPSAVTMRFTEEVVARLCTARIVDGSGRDLAGVDLSAGSDSRVLRVRVPSAPNGTYSLLWRVMSADDGHLTSGVLVFTVGAPTGQAAPAGGLDDPGVGAAAVRWLTFAGLATAIGAAVMARVLRRRPGLHDPGEGGRPSGARLGLLVLAGSGVALLALDADLALHAMSVSGPAGVGGAFTTLVTQTLWGRLWLLEFLSLAVAFTLAARSLRRRGAASEAGSGSRVVTGLLGVAVAAQALGGHAATLDGAQLAGQAAAVVHVLAALVWVGGVLALLVLLPRGGPSVRAVWRHRWRIGALFVCCTSLLAATGFVSAGLQVPSPSDLTQTAYGQVLVVKLALAVPLLAVAALNASRLHGLGRSTSPATPRVPRRRYLVAEICLGAAVLLAAAVLLDRVPSRELGPAPQSGHEQFASRTVDDLVVSISGTPGLTGANGLTVRASSTRRPEPAPIQDVDVVVRRPGSAAGSVVTQQVSMVRTEPGVWFAVVDLDDTPGLELTPVVTRQGRELSATFPWAVTASRAQPRGEGGLAPWADSLALGALVCGAAGLTVLRRKAALAAADAATAEPATAPFTAAATR